MAELKRFDPFNNRLARDIRNSLSKSFLESIREGDEAVFHRKADEYLGQKLDRSYKNYIESRLDKYENVYAAIMQGHSAGELFQAEILWDNGLYYEMHELLETVWIKAEGDERKALQGLIRAAGTKIHAESGNTKAAVSMGQKAQASLQLYGDELKGFNRCVSILAEIKDIIAALDSSQ